MTLGIDGTGRRWRWRCVDVRLTDDYDDEESQREESQREGIAGGGHDGIAWDSECRKSVVEAEGAGVGERS